MKPKNLALQLALYVVVALALGCGPALAADDEAASAEPSVASESKAAKPKAKAEKPADAKAEKAAVHEKKDAKVQSAPAKAHETAQAAAPESKDIKVEEKAPEKQETPSFTIEQAPTLPAPAAGAAPQGLFQKFRSFFGSKKAETKPALAPVTPFAAPLPLSSPPTGTSAPAAEKAGKEAPAAAALPGGFVPPPIPVPPSLVAPSAPPPAMAAVKAPDPPNLKQAEKVAKLFDLKQKLQGPLGPVTMLMMMEIDRENPGQMPVTQKAIAEAQAKFAADHEGDMQDDTARFYAENFSADELQQLKEFYESSAGQKLMKKADELQRRQSMFGNEVAMKNASTLREEVLKMIKKYDLKPPKAPASSTAKAPEPKHPEARK